LDLKAEEIREDEGYLKLRITNLDDLWLLGNIIERGDTVLGTTFRKGDERNDTVRSKKSERIRINVGIEVEEVEFQEFTDRLRVRGRIIIGPEEYLGHYQSLNFSVGDTVEIIKKYISRTLVEEIEKSEKRSIQALFVSMDDESATVAMLRDYGIQILAEIRLSKPSKEMEDGETDYGEIIEKISQYWKEGMPIFLTGPGFFKENFLKKINDQSLRSSIIPVDTSYAGERGIYEALRSGAMDRILRDYRLREEIDYVSMLLDEIGREGRYAYGFDEVKKYAEMGAVDTLLILDTKLKHEDYKQVMRTVENMGGKIVIISSHHEYGRILSNLGGIGAILRYKT
jgi:protein pelota